jgi:hypothetical protein
MLQLPVCQGPVLLFGLTKWTVAPCLLAALTVTPCLLAAYVCALCHRLGGGFLLVGYDLLKTHHTPGFSSSSSS